MRKLVSFLLLSVIYCSVVAQEYKNISLSFSPQNYSLVSNANGDYIQSMSQDEEFLPDTTAPAIPYIPVSVKIKNSNVYAGFSYTQTNSRFANGVSLMNVPKCVPTSSIQNETLNSNKPYLKKSYPENNVIFTGINNYGFYSILNFLISPWIYNAQEGALDLITSLNLCIKLMDNQKHVVPVVASMSYLNTFTNALAINANEFNDNIEPARNIQDGNTSYEYLIVTADSLSNSFSPLVEWKRKKGIPAKIITISEIASTYTGSDLPLKIKNCLYDYYCNKGLKYVLLGGDNTIVPVRGCYVTANGDIEENMPSDIYYSCFSGNFEWNANGNSFYGEVTDSIDFAPSIYVSRAPIRNSIDIAAFVNKTLTYEKSPNANGWNNNILMAGTELWANYTLDPLTSDAQAKSENLYAQAIEPYWNGNRVRFYDTYTDFSGGADYQLTASNLQSQLSEGYTFMDITTHGYYGSWTMESGSYTNSYASSLTNTNPTIITTSACLTNAFDDSTHDPCLSEAFIRNPNSNVIHYLGCSREGWDYPGGNNFLGTSLQYEKCFYEVLFGNDQPEKNWGVVTALAKAMKLNSCAGNGSSRWIQLGLNPIGDPETPIFTETPISFDTTSLNISSTGFTVNTGVPNCRISIMSTDDDGISIYKIYSNTQSATETFSNHPLSVCITKQGYIPKIYNISPTIYIQNETINEDVEYIAGQIVVGSNVTNTIPTGDVIINNCNVILKGNEVTIDSNTEVNLGATLEVNN